jgi:hypothetical protein
MSFQKESQPSKNEVNNRILVIKKRLGIKGSPSQSVKHALANLALGTFRPLERK